MCQGVVRLTPFRASWVGFRRLGGVEGAEDQAGEFDRVGLLVHEDLTYWSSRELAFPAGFAERSAQAASAHGRTLHQAAGDFDVRAFGRHAALFADDQIFPVPSTTW